MSSHDHLLSAVTVWYVAFPFGPVTAGRVEAIAEMARRVGGAMRLEAELRMVRMRTMQVG